MDRSSALFALFVAFAAAKIAAEAFNRLRLPEVVGELGVGVLLGPSLAGWVPVRGPAGTVMLLVGQLGAIVLLFQVGLASEPAALRESGRRSMVVSVLGVVFTFALGFAVAIAFGVPSAGAAFVATALSATSAAIAARVLRAADKVDAPEGRTILSAAIIDDVLGLMLLTLVVGLGARSLSGVAVAALLVEALVFVGVLFAFGPPVMTRLSHLLDAPRIERAPFAIAVIVLLGLSVAADRIGLAAIVGAFLAGVVLSGTSRHHDLADRFEPLGDLLAPLFFVVTGAQISVGVLGRPRVLLLALSITAVGAAGKVLAGRVGARDLGRRRALAVGVGMVARGEVGIIVASLALREGAIGTDLFGAVLVMVVISTLLGPPVLQRMLART